METRYRMLAHRMVIAAGAVAMSAALAMGTAMPALADDAVSGDVALAVQATEDEGLANGLTWTLEDGVLAISGEGAMEFTLSATNASVRAPWIEDENIGDYGYTDTTGITKVVIGEGVTSIAPDAFNHVTSLAEVQIPSTVKGIGDRAFNGCSALKTVTVPAQNDVASLGRGVFYDCSSLAEMPSFAKLTAIANGAYQNCASLEQASIPEGVTAIEQDAFSGCTGLRSVAFPSTLGTIGGSAFKGCAKLASVSIPAAVQTVGSNAFQGCSSLAEVAFEGSATQVNATAFWDTPYYANRSGMVIEDGHLVSCNGVDDEVVVIPDNVAVIDDYAFGKTSGAAHEGVKKVVIPAGVTKIGAWAFNRCTNLQTVEMLGMEAPSLGFGAFRDLNSGMLDPDDFEIVIPKGATGYTPGEYVKDSAGNWSYWMDYADYVGTRKQLDERKAARAAAKDAAAAVSAAIDALPNVKNVRLKDEEAIKQAKAQFDALSEEGRKLVGDAMQKKLSEVVAQLETILAARDKDGTPIDEATFPDYALRSVVLYDWDSDRNEKLDAAETAAVSKIDVTDGWRDSADAPLNKVASLKGIELFGGLKELYVSNNALSSIDVKGLANLDIIDASDNKIRSIDASAFEALEELYVAGNELTALDVSGSEGLTKLDAANNRLASVDLSNNMYLEELDLSGNQLVALDLEGLSLSYAKVAGQKRTVKASGSTLDMKSLDKRFDGSKVSQLKGAKLSGSTLSGFGSGDVTYVYDCGSGQTMDVTLSVKVEKPAADKPAAPKAQKLSGKASISMAMGSKPFALGVASDAKGAKLSYKTSNKKVATVDAKGKVALKGAGTCKITVTSTAKGYQKATKAVTVKATLAKASLTKATKSPKKGRLTVAWKKVAGAQGYQVKVAVGKKAKTYTVKGAKALTKTVKAAAGKKAKVQVRALSKASGKAVYGKWSAAKTVKVKK